MEHAIERFLHCIWTATMLLLFEGGNDKEKFCEQPLKTKRKVSHQW
jgi:hypothetical protein